MRLCPEDCVIKVQHLHEGILPGFSLSVIYFSDLGQGGMDMKSPLNMAALAAAWSLAISSLWCWPFFESSLARG